MIMPVILFVDHAVGLGGAEQSLLLLLKHLDRERFSPHVAGVGGPLLDAVRNLGIPVHSVALPRLRRSLHAPPDLAAGARMLARIAREVGARCLIANTVRAAIYAAPAAGVVSRCSFIWYMRDFWLGESEPNSLGVDVWGKRLLCGAAAGVVANSNATAAQLPCSRKVTVIHNGIEVTQFEPQRDSAKFRSDYGIPASAPVIGMVGRLRPWKGPDRFLRVFARVYEVVKNLHGLIVGGNPFGEEDDYARSLKSLAIELGVREQIHFTGQVVDPRPALAAMDVFVHPGDPEPFGLVNIEAMAMAKPVVAFAHGALPEIVLDGETGRLVMPGDEAAMSAALGSLLRDRDLRERFGRQGRRRAEVHFDVRQTAQRFEKSLVDCLHL